MSISFKTRCSLTFPALLLIASCGVVGCAPKEIDLTHGKRRSDSGGSSVNGTAVLADLFQEAGYYVRTWRRLSPKLDQADVIVWVPDDFSPPTLEQCEFLDEWLSNGSARTLVYVGRDYDSGIAYWEFVRGVAPPSQAMEAARRLARVQSEYDAERAAVPEKQECRWFTVRGGGSHRRVRELDGPWSDGIDVSRTDISVARRLEPAADVDARILLGSGGDPLVFEREWRNGKAITVVNGSFLLNLPLVNHEHRKLAGKLVASCGAGRRVVFLESGQGGPPIMEREPDANYATGLEMFAVPPMGTILLHFALAGITLCFASFPIFGRPRELPVASTSDFGKHVSALGDLLARTNDREYAIERLKYYNEHVRGD